MATKSKSKKRSKKSKSAHRREIQTAEVSISRPAELAPILRGLMQQNPRSAADRFVVVRFSDPEREKKKQPGNSPHAAI